MSICQYVAKPVMTNYCLEWPPVLKDHIFASDLAYLVLWLTLSPETSCLIEATLLQPMGWSFNAGSNVADVPVCLRDLQGLYLNINLYLHGCTTQKKFVRNWDRTLLRKLFRTFLSMLRREVVTTRQILPPRHCIYNLRSWDFRINVQQEHLIQYTEN